METDKFDTICTLVEAFENSRVVVENSYVVRTEKTIGLILFIPIIGLVFIRTPISYAIAIFLFTLIVIVFFKKRFNETEFFKAILRRMWKKRIEKDLFIVQYDIGKKLEKLKPFIRNMILSKRDLAKSQKAWNIFESFLQKDSSKEEVIHQDYFKG